MSTVTEPGSLVVRETAPDDAEAFGRIFYDAFESIAVRHNFPVETVSPEAARFVLGHIMATDGVFGLVAEQDGTVVGGLFVDERGPIAGIGPVAVDPAAQDGGIGRALMEAVLVREREREAPGVRLVQTAYHYRSFALYAKLGFVVREPLSVLQGTPPAISIPGLGVRAARPDDVEACGELCRRVHGHDRGAEFAGAVAAGSAVVVERPDGIAGYATGFGYGFHAIAETNDELVALLGSPEAFLGLGILVPSRNAELLRWCLEHDLRIVQQSTLMTIGLYNEPSGAWMPSIAY